MRPCQSTLVARHVSPAFNRQVVGLPIPFPSMQPVSPSSIERRFVWAGPHCTYMQSSPSLSITPWRFFPPRLRMVPEFGICSGLQLRGTTAHVGAARRRQSWPNSDCCAKCFQRLDLRMLCGLARAVSFSGNLQCVVLPETARSGVLVSKVWPTRVERRAQHDASLLSWLEALLNLLIFRQGGFGNLAPSAWPIPFPLRYP